MTAVAAPVGDAGHERRVGEQHCHPAFEPLQQITCGEHGVACAERRVLDSDLGRDDGFRDRVHVLAQNDDAARGACFGGCSQNVVDHAAAGDLVQHLRQRRLHARAFARGQDDCGKRFLSCGRGGCGQTKPSENRGLPASWRRDADIRAPASKIKKCFAFLPKKWQMAASSSCES